MVIIKTTTKLNCDVIEEDEPDQISFKIVFVFEICLFLLLLLIEFC
jgi:hypothetical protein